MRILITDDDSATLDFVSRALSADGHQIVSATDGTEAWAKFQADGAFDLLITDISMPGMDGVALAQKVLDASPGIKVIMMSGLDTELDRVEGLAGSNITTLTKPFTLEAIRALVNAG